MVCNQDIGESDVIKCDICPNWIHFACSGLRVIDIDHRSGDKLPNSIKYHCVGCQSTPLVKYDNTCNCSNASSKQDLAIESLTKIVSTLQSQMEVMLAMLTGKEGEATFEKKVEAHLGQALQDEREKEEKKNNIMLFNVPESEKPEALDAAQDDVTLVREILTHVRPDINFGIIEAAQVSRLGFKKDDNKARPIKIKLSQTEHKFKLLKDSRKLSNFEKYPKIGLSKDKTKSEIAADRNLKIELARRKEAEPSKDFIIFRRKVMLRSDKEAILQEQDAQSRDGSLGSGARADPDHH